MPAWAVAVVGAAAFMTAVGSLWKGVLNPIRKAGNRAEQMLPLLVELTETFHDWPVAFQVLRSMADQFKTDSGSSLRDVVNRLTSMAETGVASAALVAVGVEASRLLAVRDREELSRLLIQQDRTAAKIDAALLALDVIRGGQRSMSEQAEGVADDLAASHARADAVTGTPGEAGDAAARGAA